MTSTNGFHALSIDMQRPESPASSHSSEAEESCSSPSEDSSTETPKLLFQEGDIPKLKHAVRALTANYDALDALCQFMITPRNMEEPSLRHHVQSLAGRLSKNSAMCFEFLQTLEAENEAVREMLAEASSATTEQERWWEAGDLFSSSKSLIMRTNSLM